jgi:hypothetical protein
MNVIAFKKISSREKIYGTIKVVAIQDVPVPVRANQIRLSRQRIAQATPPARNELEVVMMRVSLPSGGPRPDTFEDDQQRQPSPLDSVVTGKPSLEEQEARNSLIGGDVKGSDNVTLKNARVELRVADTGYVEGHTVSYEGQFHLKVPRAGDYILTILADGYEPLNYLVIKQDPNTPLFVFDGDGKQVPLEFEAQMRELASNHERDESQLINLQEAARRFVALPSLLEALPLPEPRGFDSFALLAPGVLPPPQTTNTAGPGLTSGIGSAGQFSINGLRSRENNFNVDGSDNNDEDVGARRQGFVYPTSQPPESLKEFQIITALADVRFGRNIGGQINVLTKTGGEEYHGSAYSIFNHQRFNARDAFDLPDRDAPSSFAVGENTSVLLDGQPVIVKNPVEGKNPLMHTELGVNLSGPLFRRSEKQSNTFIFASGEVRRISARQETNFAVPSVRQRGLFNSGESGLSIGTTKFTPASIPGNAIFSLYPFPNNPSGPYGPNTYTAVLPADKKGLQVSTKLDHYFGVFNDRPRKFWSFGSSGDVLTGRYNQTFETSIIPVTGDALYSSLRSKVRTHNMAFFFNRTFSSKTADAIRFSFGRTHLSFHEARDPSLLPSAALPGTPFLLNAPLMLNTTTPGTTPNVTNYSSAASSSGTMLLRNILGYPSITQTEQITGPLGQVIIAGFSPVGVDAYNFPQTRRNNTFQVAETVTHIRPRQILTAGFDIRKTFINSALERNNRPVAVFNGLSDSTGLFAEQLIDGATLAAAGVPTGLFQTLALKPATKLKVSFSQFDFFLQDEWRLGARVRLIAGLRYGLNTVPQTADGRLERPLDRDLLLEEARQAALDCNNVGPSGRCNDLIGALGAAFPPDFKVTYDGDHSDFDPRIGFAWSTGGVWKNRLLRSVFGSLGRSVVRGGFGVYNGQYPGTVISQSRNAFPDFLPVNLSNFSPRSGGTTYLFNLANPAVQQLGTPNPLAILAPGTLNTLAGNPVSFLTNRLFNLQSLTLSPTVLGLDLVLPQGKLKTPYALQYALTLERQLSDNLSLDLSYVGTRGVKLLRVSTPNLGLNRSRIDFSGVTPLDPAAPFPFFSGNVAPPRSQLISQSFTVARTLFESSALSTYNSLQLDLRKRYHRSFQFGAAFTYSHTIDDASDFFDTAGAYALPQNSLVRSERASSNFDVRFRSAGNFVVDIPRDLPFLRGGGKGGWQVAGVILFQTGQPFTVNSAFDINRDGNMTDRLNTTTGLIRNPFPNDRRIQLALSRGTTPQSLLAANGLDGAVGRNTFRAPKSATVDISIVKKFTLGEGGRFSVRADIFNLFNRVNYGIPVRTLEFPGFGNSINTTTPARRILFSARYSF